MTNIELARVALREAINARQKAGVDQMDPICVYDFAEKLNAEVWFCEGASFGGMYAKGYGRLFVPAERPAGRRVFTCAHELAHKWFRHGTRVDELDFDRPDNDNPEERLANLFAGYLLMPRRGILNAFEKRKISPKTPTPLAVYAVASQFGVGYQTLLCHMCWSIKILDDRSFAELKNIAPKEIRKSVLGCVEKNHMVLADEHWEKVAIDLEVGDKAVIPTGCSVKGASIRVDGHSPHGTILRAVRPGLAQIIRHGGEWSSIARVCKKQFTGMGAYRHMEDPDYE